jgi:hypothetical protein
MTKKKSNNTLLIILIVIAVILVISLILYFSLFKENYKRKKGRKMNRRKCEELFGGTWKKRKRKCILPDGNLLIEIGDDEDLNVTGGWFDEDPFYHSKIYPR